MPDITIPKIPLGYWVEQGINFLLAHFSEVTRWISQEMNSFLTAFENLLLAVHPLALIAAAAIGIAFLTRKRSLTVFVFVSLGLVWNLELWPEAMSTLTLVLVATSLAVGIGVPLGIAAAIYTSLHRVIMPVLDMMQTMPAFVYLIPAIPFFGLGKVSALFATMIFATPPAIRFTYLGIRQVPRELVECAEAFGATRAQRLFTLELPIAAPTIVAGINQTIMLALSMVVVAAMIGAKGLGGAVWRSIQRLEMGSGFEAGLGIVILAICLDRVLQNLVNRIRTKTRV
ncbi:Glycine betaine/carnitine transport permease protein GbuB [uncultured delta proteobacterium]|uniref:Glycine betaine/carnitine transport permease protein GbuB n=1 Tax=uncultured delta proteobacterium TaxID=34034 RepID=A0A212KCG3_9DELT|nr:Glycine betaine/carnitine transport permease protein GbuB [uncultured delta proteobacterium]